MSDFKVSQEFLFNVVFFVCVEFEMLEYIIWEYTWAGVRAVCIPE